MRDLATRSRWWRSVLLATVLACAWAPAAHAWLYWADDDTATTGSGAIQRANLDGTSFGTNLPQSRSR